MFSTKGEEDYRNGQRCLIVPNSCNLRDAMVYFEKAADEGHIEAAYQLGYLYLIGEPYIARNCKQALSCFENVQRQGCQKRNMKSRGFILRG